MNFPARALTSVSSGSDRKECFNRLATSRSAPKLKTVTDGLYRKNINEIRHLIKNCSPRSMEWTLELRKPGLASTPLSKSRGLAFPPQFYDDDL